MNKDRNHDALQTVVDDANCDALILSQSVAQCLFHGALLTVQGDHHKM